MQQAPGLGKQPGEVKNVKIAICIVEETRSAIDATLDGVDGQARYDEARVARHSRSTNGNISALTGKRGASLF